MGKETIAPFFALAILIVGSTSALYVHATQNTSETITIFTQSYTIEQVFLMSEPRTLADLDVTGVSLDDLVVKAGVPTPETHGYTIIGADGYQKTVKWENMKNGVLTRERQVCFSDLPKAFRVRDVVSIKVT